MKPKGRYFTLFGLITILLAGCTQKVLHEQNKALSIPADYSIASNIVYKEADSVELELDVYVPSILLGEDPWVKYTDKMKPTLVFFHGGGWVSGDRISRSLLFLPYLEQNWCVVNVDYRLADGSRAVLDDAVADCRDAIEWVFENAAAFHIDTNQIYLSGESAGGHLALLTGFKFRYPGHIAGVINWFGISDMEVLYHYWSDTSFFNRMTGSTGQGTIEIMMQNSPVQFIDDKQVPVISIHGDQDYGVPIAQSETLHRLLEAKGIKNKLVVIKGKKHGNFSPEDYTYAYREIWKFVE